jgi:hypothetical protein
MFGEGNGDGRLTGRRLHHHCPNFNRTASTWLSLPPVEELGSGGRMYGRSVLGGGVTRDSFITCCFQ